jgi:Tol biopolymer transport system component
MNKADADEGKGMAFLQDVIDNYKDLKDLVDEAIRLRGLGRSAAGDSQPLQIVTPFTSDPYSFAISPDGRNVVYLASSNGSTSLWLYNIDTKKAGSISGTESAGYGPAIGGAHPFWSPDGKSIGFFVEGKLKRIAATGGTAITLADAPGNYGGSWSSDGTIIFVARNLSGVLRIPAIGGTPTPVTQNEGPRMSHRYPQFLPDGRHLLFYRIDLASNERSGLLSLLAVARLDGRLNVTPLNPAALGPSVQAARFGPPDQLLFVSNRELFGQRLDPATFELIGSRTRVVDRVADYLSTTTPGYAAVSVSAAGPIAYRSNDAARTQLTWYDRQGRRGATLGEPDETAVTTPRFSQDGRTVALFSVKGDGAYARLIDASNGSTRMVFLTENGRFRWNNLAWSASAEHVVFSQTLGPTSGASNLYRKPVNGGPAELVAQPWDKRPTDSSPDGQFLLYSDTPVDQPYRSLFLLRQNTSQFRPVVAGPSDNGRFSPLGDAIAYEKRVADRDEIYLQRFPEGDIQRVSLNGGRSPEWSRDGRELYFVSPDNRLMAVSIKLPENESVKIEIGRPTALFTLPDASTFAPAPDGRFLVNAPIEATPPIVVLSNWTRSTGTITSSAEPSVQRASATVNTVPPGSPIPAAAGSRPRTATRQIEIYNRQGALERTVGEEIESLFPTSGPGTIALSPDGARLAIIRNGTLWNIDISKNESFGVAAATAQTPVWSPDGGRIVYYAERSTTAGLYSRSANGSDDEAFLYAPRSGNLFNWSLDGRFLGFVTDGNFAALQMTAPGREPIGHLPANGKNSFRISPDSSLIAYVSNENGRNQVFVRGFDPSGSAAAAGSQHQVSLEGTVGMVRWRSDGKELYYLAADGRVMAVTITTMPQIQVGSPQSLFRAPVNLPLAVGRSEAVADVSGDGQRFAFSVSVP